MVHFRPSLSATNAAGIMPTKLITAIPANSSPAITRTFLSKLQHFSEDGLSNVAQGSVPAENRLSCMSQLWAPRVVSACQMEFRNIIGMSAPMMVVVKPNACVPSSGTNTEREPLAVINMMPFTSDTARKSRLSSSSCHPGRARSFLHAKPLAHVCTHHTFCTHNYAKPASQSQVIYTSVFNSASGIFL